MASRTSHAGRAPHEFAALASGASSPTSETRQAPSFRVSARRADKQLPFTSPQIEREVGGLIKEAKGWHVSLDDPALTIHVEMMPDHAFYYFGKEPGAGGLPTATGGRVACLLSGGIDSPVAAYRMMRRGCSVLLIHFHSYPILSRASQEKVREIATLLTRYQLRSRLHLVPFGELQQQILLACSPAALVYRRAAIAQLGADGGPGLWSPAKSWARSPRRSTHTIGAAPWMLRPASGRREIVEQARTRRSHFHHPRPGLLSAVHPAMARARPGIGRPSACCRSTWWTRRSPPLSWSSGFPSGWRSQHRHAPPVLSASILESAVLTADAWLASWRRTNREILAATRLLGAPSADDSQKVCTCPSVDRLFAPI